MGDVNPHVNSATSTNTIPAVSSVTNIDPNLVPLTSINQKALRDPPPPKNIKKRLRNQSISKATIPKDASLKTSHRPGSDDKTCLTIPDTSSESDDVVCLDTKISR